MMLSSHLSHSWPLLMRASEYSTGFCQNAAHFFSLPWNCPGGWVHGRPFAQARGLRKTRVNLLYRILCHRLFADKCRFAHYMVRLGCYPHAALISDSA